MPDRRGRRSQPYVWALAVLTFELGEKILTPSSLDEIFAT